MDEMARRARVARDETKLAALCAESDLISFSATDAERFHLRLRCRGLAELNGRFRYTVHHEAEVYLPAEYPLVPPVVEWRTPLFHPNILGGNHPHHPGATCLGPWSPSVYLDRLAVQLADMVSLRAYNLSSPLNPMAAQWVRLNLARVPVDRRPVRKVVTEGCEVQAVGL